MRQIILTYVINAKSYIFIKIKNTNKILDINNHFLEKNH